VIPTTLIALAFVTPIHPATSQPVVKVDNSKIYSNIKIEGAEHLRRAGVGLDNKDLGKLVEAAHEVEKPHLYLVRGTDLVGVLNAHLAAISGDSNPERIIFAEGTGDTKAEVWVAAYLGNGPGTAVMKVRGVEVEGDVIRVLTAKVEIMTATADSNPYLVWVNLGHLAAGSYSLQLIHGETPLKATTVATRTVTVERKK
jgi:hypothetical protein